jgi:hypothetical protein
MKNNTANMRARLTLESIQAKIDKKRKLIESKKSLNEQRAIAFMHKNKKLENFKYEDKDLVEKREKRLFKKQWNLYVRQVKLMNELTICLFHPSHAHMYAGLAKLSFPYTPDSEKDIEIATAMTHIGYFIVHTSKYLNVWLRYPMWLQTLILKDQYRIYCLNPSKTTSASFEKAVEMLTDNVYSIALMIQVMSSDNTKDVYNNDGIEETKQQDDYFFTPDIVSQIENNGRGNSEKRSKSEVSNVTTLNTSENLLLTSLSKIVDFVMK